MQRGSDLLDLFVGADGMDAIGKQGYEEIFFWIAPN
jgi:hypothetical protein